MKYNNWAFGAFSALAILALAVSYRQERLSYFQGQRNQCFEIYKFEKAQDGMTTGWEYSRGDDACRIVYRKEFPAPSLDECYRVVTDAPKDTSASILKLMRQQAVECSLDFYKVVR